MLNVRPWLWCVVAGALSAAGVSASAAGFASGGSGAVLGQRLSFSVSFRVDAGESLTPACVKAEVQFGDRRLPASQVSTTLDMQASGLARIRVLTDTVVDEPVVDVLLNAGCSAPQARRFVLFADPPRVIPVVAAAPVDALQSGGSGSRGTRGLLEASANDGSVAAALTQPTALNTFAAQVPTAPASPRAQPTNRKPAAKRRTEPAQRPASARAARSSAATKPAANRAPRLELDFAEPSLGQPDAIDAALAAVSAAASATQAANDAAAAAADRMAAVERDVERMRAELRANQMVVAQWQTRLADAQAASRWLWPLVALVLALAALAGWLAWRLMHAERQRQSPWREAAAELAPTATDEPVFAEATPFVTAGGKRTVNDPTRPRGTPAWPPPAPPETLPPPMPSDTLPPPDQPETVRRALPSKRGAPDFTPDPEMSTVRAGMDLSFEPQRSHRESPIERTMPYLSAAASEISMPRDVSIEELIDLEQQAEFFVVLGQDEAAVDLLVDHLRQTGGGSPLPYLKLLEIYHRRVDREEYERTRERFNQRFNAYAPEWEMGLNSGRSLEDYTGVVPRVQQVWPRSLDAMAELEALLFRKSRGELFDLPAYREVLFLYALARDLLDRESTDTSNVDLLLPMADGTEFGSTEPAPYLTLDAIDLDDDRAGPQTLPMAPVDVDLTSDATRPTSIFDALHDTQHQPRSR